MIVLNVLIIIVFFLRVGKIINMKKYLERSESEKIRKVNRESKFSVSWLEFFRVTLVLFGISNFERTYHVTATIVLFLCLVYIEIYINKSFFLVDKGLYKFNKTVILWKEINEIKYKKIKNKIQVVFYVNEGKKMKKKFEDIKVIEIIEKIKDNLENKREKEIHQS